LILSLWLCTVPGWYVGISRLKKREGLNLVVFVVVFVTLELLTDFGFFYLKQYACKKSLKIFEKHIILLTVGKGLSIYNINEEIWIKTEQ
jgi:hypothetical protein